MTRFPRTLHMPAARKLAAELLAAAALILAAWATATAIYTRARYAREIGGRE